MIWIDRSECIYMHMYIKESFNIDEGMEGNTQGVYTYIHMYIYVIELTNGQTCMCIYMSIYIYAHVFQRIL
jgi:hypothetical protein